MRGSAGGPGGCCTLRLVVQVYRRIKAVAATAQSKIVVVAQVSAVNIGDKVRRAEDSCGRQATKAD
jgi:hypothetical protein